MLLICGTWALFHKWLRDFSNPQVRGCFYVEKEREEIKKEKRKRIERERGKSLFGNKSQNSYNI